MEKNTYPFTIHNQPPPSPALNSVNFFIYVSIYSCAYSLTLPLIYLPTYFLTYITDRNSEPEQPRAAGQSEEFIHRDSKHRADGSEPELQLDSADEVGRQEPQIDDC